MKHAIGEDATALAGGGEVPGGAAGVPEAARRPLRAGVPGWTHPCGVPDRRRRPASSRRHDVPTLLHLVSELVMLFRSPLRHGGCRIG